MTTAAPNSLSPSFVVVSSAAARPSRTIGPTVNVMPAAFVERATRRRAGPGAMVKVEPEPVAIDADASPADGIDATYVKLPPERRTGPSVSSVWPAPER